MELFGYLVIEQEPAGFSYTGLVRNIDPNVEWGEQNEEGVDLAILRFNLSLTDEQKIEQHQKAARFALECMSAAERTGVSRPT